MKYKFVIQDNNKNISKYYVDSSITNGEVSKDTACILANLFFQMCQKGFEVTDEGLFTLIYNSIEPYPLIKGINLINTFFSKAFTIIQASIIKEEIIFDKTVKTEVDIKPDVKPNIVKEDVKTSVTGYTDLKKIPCGNNGQFILIVCADRVFIAHRKPSDKNMTSPNRICITDSVADEFFIDLSSTGNKCSIYKKESPMLFLDWKSMTKEIYEKQKAEYLRSLK